jgi:PGF-CTERM protein
MILTSVALFRLIATQPVAADGVQVTYDKATPYEGEVVTATNESDIVSGSSYPVYRVDTVNESTDTVTDYTEVATVTGQDNGVVYIHTNGYTTGEQFFVASETSNLSAGVTPGEDTFTVQENSFEADIEASTIKNGVGTTTTQLSLTSNSNQFDVRLTSNKLSNTQFARILTGQNNVDLSESELSESAYSTTSVTGSQLAGHITTDAVSQHVTYNDQRKTYVVSDEFFTATTDSIADGASLTDIGVGSIERYRSTFGFAVLQSSNGDLVVKNGGRNSIDFSGIGSQSYEISFEVVGTDFTASDSIVVQDGSVEGEFSQDTYTDTAGSIVTLEATSSDVSTAYIQISDESTGFIDVIEVTGSPFMFKVNTRLLGSDAPTEEVYQGVDGSSVVNSAVHGSLGSNAQSSAVFTDDDSEVINPDAGSAFQAYLAELNLIESPTSPPTSQLTRPLQPAEYTVTAAAEGDGAYMIGSGDSSEPVNELASTTLELEKPEVESMSAYIAPSGVADKQTQVSNLEDVLTERSNVPAGDRVVLKAEVTGLDGYLSAVNDDVYDVTSDSNDDDQYGPPAPLSELTNLEGEGIDVVIEETGTTGNQEAAQFDLTKQSSEEIMFYPQDNTWYIVIDTRETDSLLADSEITVDSSYRASIELSADGDADQYEFADTGNGAVGDAFSGGGNGDSSIDSFAYYSPGETSSASASFNYVERSASIDGLSDQAVLLLETTEEQTIAGETNTAPGTELEVVAERRSDESTFSKEQSVSVDEDGAFSTTFDFSSETPDSEFTIALSANNEEFQETSGRLVEDLEAINASDVDTEDLENSSDSDGTSDNSTSDGGDNTTNADGSADGSSGDSSSDSTPGFGVVVAVIALTVAGFAALRRS